MAFREAQVVRHRLDMTVEKVHVSTLATEREAENSPLEVNPTKT